jgi:hypothetical protein
MSEPRDVLRDDLDERLRHHYAGQRLGAAELARLRAAVEAAAGGRSAGSAPSRPPGASDHDSPPRRNLRRDLVLWVGAAAALVAGAFVAARLLERRAAWNGAAGAAEIARHHLEDKPPEQLADSVAALGPLLPKLGFAPVDPPLLRSEQLSVEGGRYCKLSGVQAIQVRLRDAAGRTCTLYELLAPSALPAASREEHVVGGVRVRLWREGGLLFGLAQPR